jgi:outer membrane protein OmpA-like peptidoglycan-associated protein
MNNHSLITLLCAGSLAACSHVSPTPPAQNATIVQPAPAVATGAVSVAPATASPPKALNESLTISFSDASTTLSPDAQSQLDGAARLYRDAGPEVMIVSGHTDRSGAEFQNILLSARRAEKVKQALVDRGVPSDKLQIVAIGEAEPVPGVQPSRSAVVTWR